MTFLWLLTLSPLVETLSPWLALYPDSTKKININLYTLELHYNAVHVGIHRGKNLHYNGSRLLFKIVNATSLPGFHTCKQMPHPPSFGMGHQSVYLVLYL